MTVSLRAEHVLRNTDRLRHHIGGNILRIIAEPGIVEVSANPDGSLWVDRLGQDGMARAGSIDPTDAELFINSVAAAVGQCIDRQTTPSLSAELPNEEPWRGARFQAWLPPISSGPTFSLRMHASAIYTLAEYEASGIMTSEQRIAIEHAVRNRRNILVAGETASGKSTLLNAILAFVAETAPRDRILLIEDTSELQCMSENKVHAHTTREVTMQTLLRDAMRNRPDRIVIGEVRGAEALSFIKALGTGHEGYCTIHAGSALGALHRLETCIQEASVTPQRSQIAAAINLVVIIRRDMTKPAGRIVRDVAMLSPNLDQRGEYMFTTNED